MTAAMHESSARIKNIRVYDLEIDTVKKAVHRSGKIIDLTEREFSILELLGRNLGRVVTRSQVWESLYDEVDWNSSNIIDVYIHRLRQKIDSGFAKRLIRTKRGRGYYLLAEEG